ncbi:MAG: PKD domain-containing protein, partial [Methanomassiliicoccales archaeon]|nr:PKD domain-containing protein [Methanomassiliicoccales archaeon]
ADPDGSVVDVRWDFGDGASSDVNSPTHQYADDGAYAVTLTIWDDDGASNTTSRVVQVSNSLASVSFETSTSPTSLENVSFFDRSNDPDGTIVSWNWSFGDGSWSEEMSPVHSYARPGDYVVVLTVEDDDGEVNSTEATLNVKNLSPVSDFDWEAESENAASTIRFRNMASDPDGSVASCDWVFGDGGTSTDSSPEHVFSGEGTYDVTLTVTDDWGDISSATKTIVVSLPDLQVTLSDMSITPDAVRPGQNLTISIGIENNGSRSIHGAIIVFLIDGEAIGSEALDISSYSTATAEISWTAMEGDHELVIEVDSGETIIEISEQNNRATFHFNVAGGQSDPLLLDPDIGIIALLVGVIAVIVCMVIVLRLKGKSGKR